MTPSEFVAAVANNKLTLSYARIEGGWVILDARGARMAYSDGRAVEPNPIVAVEDALAERARRVAEAEDIAARKLFRAMANGDHPRPSTITNEEGQPEIAWDACALDGTVLTPMKYGSAVAAMRALVESRRT